MTEEIAEPKSRAYAKFAAIWFLIAGAFSIIAGLAALFDTKYFNDGKYIYHNLTLWGAIWLGIGVLQALVGWRILGGSKGAVSLGVFLACVGAVIWFFCIGIMPVWAIVHLVAYALIIYGLLIHEAFSVS